MKYRDLVYDFRQITKLKQYYNDVMWYVNNNGKRVHIHF